MNDPEPIKTELDDGKNIHCRVMEYIPQWQEKIGRKLFPASYIEWPEMEGAKDGLHCDITVELSMLDRIRVLFSGKLEVTAKTATENLLGAHKTVTGVRVLPPFYLDRIDPNPISQPIVTP